MSWASDKARGLVGDAEAYWLTGGVRDLVERAIRETLARAREAIQDVEVMSKLDREVRDDCEAAIRKLGEP